MKNAQIISFNRLSQSNVLFNENYIPPAAESSMKYYASKHHYDYKGLWEAPLVLIQSNTDKNIFNVYLIPEVATLIKSQYRAAERFHGETVALRVKQGIYHIKKIGIVEIVQNTNQQWIAKSCGVPEEYKDLAIKSIVKTGKELGISIQTENETTTLKKVI